MLRLVGDTVHDSDSCFYVTGGLGIWQLAANLYR